MRKDTESGGLMPKNILILEEGLRSFSTRCCSPDCQIRAEITCRRRFVESATTGQRRPKLGDRARQISLGQSVTSPGPY
jgi:hypothetical protein